MSLTFAPGPLATPPPSAVNYTLDGPAHRLLMTPFPRRVRAELAGMTVFDTVRGQLVHESNLLPVLYVPDDDWDVSHLEPTDHTTHCPFKGDASYWSVRLGDRVAENAVWAYRDPLDAAAWLRGFRACYWDRLDHWFDEDEEVFAHLRDPYHRTDVRPSSRTVVVRVADTVVAKSARAVVLSETGLPNRWYVPIDDVRTDLLAASQTTSHCPYKGDATYWSFRDGDTEIADVAWEYEQPYDSVRRIAGHRSFAGDDVAVEITAR